MMIIMYMLFLDIITSYLSVGFIVKSHSHCWCISSFTLFYYISSYITHAADFEPRKQGNDHEIESGL